ncbi:transcriptional regulator [Xaviernesmea oryzae]|uniref:Transcriptional regulator n=1 Tax=Xaviernesmea oryzae TaxID=464029 RepID=A0A1Q9AZ40_9HYPH|nr:LysR family transcriptional regulator [Xaviernesmea oryzae]OLP60944.1 transcriptional regulator [Xaviernesmea oryzae]SEL20716.1 molybdate transport system regulatory protein [Xaviernesmea oryzae]
MAKGTQQALKPVIRIDFPAERLGHGKIRLLELIAETGSISAAGRAMDMSYRRAWMLVAALNSMFAEEAVSSQRGGRQGGGAALTPFGEALIACFRAMEARAAEALAQDLVWLEARRAPEQTAADGPRI